MGSLKKRADNLYNAYKFIFQFKIDDDSREGIKFLFQDYKTHTIVDGKQKRLKLVEDKDNSINWIKVENDDINADNTEKLENDGGNKVNTIYSLINELQGFLREFQTGITNLYL